MNGYSLDARSKSDSVMSNKEKVAVPTIERAFRILEALSEEENGSGISELSKELGLAKSTTFNILTSLTQLGYCYKSGADGKFHLSLKLYSLGSAAAERMDLRRLAASILRDLADGAGETINLGTIQGDEAVYIDCLPSSHPVTVVTWPGQRLPLHSTALGKALLAWRPLEEAQTILAGSELKAFTPATVTSIPQILRELQRVRADGYALDNEEDALGMRCIGAPVFDQSGRAVAAISLTAPLQRLPEGDFGRVAEQVITSAGQISRRLGYMPEPLALALAH